MSLIPFTLQPTHDHNETHYGAPPDHISLVVYRGHHESNPGHYTVLSVFPVRWVTSLNNGLCTYQVYQGENRVHYCNNIRTPLRSAIIPISDTGLRPMFDAMFEEDPMRDYIFLDALLVKLAEIAPLSFDQSQAYKTLKDIVAKQFGLKFEVRSLHLRELNKFGWSVDYSPA